MTERQAWERGEQHATRLIGEADAARRVRAARAETDRIGAGRRIVATLTRSLATRLTGVADALEGRRRTIST
jgi:hypothetical protein